MDLLVDIMNHANIQELTPESEYDILVACCHRNHLVKCKKIVYGEKERFYDIARLSKYEQNIILPYYLLDLISQFKQSDCIVESSRIIREFDERLLMLLP